MNKGSKIYVAGHNGLVGSAIVRRLKKEGYCNIVCYSHRDRDLTCESDVDAIFEKNKPEYVFMAAAKVGGIYANSTYPAEFIYSNLKVQTNVIDACWRYKVKKMMFLGSSCVYPRYVPQPMNEDSLLMSSMEPTNIAYAVAKIAGIIMCQSYNKQYGTNFISVMPTNLYGIGDNYHLQNSHVVPALIRKFHESKISGDMAVHVWGTGMPIRELMLSDDLADACVFLMNNYDDSEIINIGTGEGISIRELAHKIKKTVDYAGEITFDIDMPDGTPKKVIDCSKIHLLGWKHKTDLDDGLKIAYEDYLSRL